MKDFKEFLKERAIMDNDLKNFDTIKKTITNKNILKIVKSEIKKLKKEFINLKWEEIKFQETYRYDKKLAYSLTWNKKLFQ